MRRDDPDLLDVDGSCTIPNEPSKGEASDEKPEPHKEWIGCPDSTRSPCEDDGRSPPQGAVRKNPHVELPPITGVVSRVRETISWPFDRETPRADAQGMARRIESNPDGSQNPPVHQSESLRHA